MHKAARAASALLVWGMLCALPAMAACRIHSREQVVLFGAGDDPGVFVWDSRFRLRAYHAGTFDEAQALLPHALLVRGGTRAIVIRCYRNDVEPRYSLSLDDAVEVRLVTGSQHGSVGWVLGRDVRVMLSNHISNHSRDKTRTDGGGSRRGAARVPF
jgi:hypothetical protein